VFDTCSWRVIDVNNKAAKMYGYSRDEFLQLTLDDIEAADCESPVRITDTASPGHVRIPLNYHRRKSLDLIPIEASVSTIDLSEQRVTCVVARDISYRVGVERALVESEKKYRDLVEHAGVGIVVSDSAGRLTYCNETFANIFGYSTDGMQHLTFKDLAHPEFVKALSVNHRKHMENDDKRWSFEFEGLNRRGEVIYLEVSVVSLMERDKVVAWQSYVRDVTEKKRVELELLASRERYHELFNSVMEGIAVVDADERIIYCNPAFAGMLGLQSEDDLLGKRVLDFISETHHEDLLRKTRTREGKAGLRFEVECHKGSRTSVPTQI